MIMNKSDYLQEIFNSDPEIVWEIGNEEYIELVGSMSESNVSWLEEEITKKTLPFVKTLWKEIKKGGTR